MAAYLVWPGQNSQAWLCATPDTGLARPLPSPSPRRECLEPPRWHLQTLRQSMGKCAEGISLSHPPNRPPFQGETFAYAAVVRVGASTGLSSSTSVAAFHEPS